MRGEQLVLSVDADGFAQLVARRVDGVGIDHVHPLGDQGVARHQDCLGLEGRIERVRTERRTDCADDRLSFNRLAARGGGQRRIINSCIAS